MDTTIHWPFSQRCASCIYGTLLLDDEDHHYSCDLQGQDGSECEYFQERSLAEDED